jgi:tetratricopeptide (TPR) repeat protein
MALYAQKKLKESAESYFSALQFDPKNEVAWVNYAWVLSDAGMYDQAITEYDKILKIYPKSQKAQKGLQTTLDRRSKVQNK